jgi:4-hydroxybenzoate polyprenyltransferase
MDRLRQYLRLLRLGHWVKNGFLFLPLFFDKQLFDKHLFAKVFMAALAFALVSSAVYVFNDYRDRHRDALHPIKKNRPLASGAITPLAGFMAALACAVLAAALVWYVKSWPLGLVLLFYFFINVLYSLGLKRISILDVFMVSFGYLLRVYAGGEVAHIAPSEWLMLMSLLLALFLALAKRRQSIEGYNQAFLNTALSMLGGIMIVCYAMYVLSPDTIARYGGNHMFLTILFVLAGVLRYVQVTLVEQGSGSPVNLLYKDRFLQVTIAGWLLGLVWIIYFYKP